MAAGHYDELLNSLKRLYLDPEFSDLSIVSTNKTYPVHKAVVCPRSPYLAEKCRDPGFAASGNRIEVKEDDPQAVHLVIEYLYNLDYSDTLPEDLLVQPETNGHDHNHEHGTPTLDRFTPESPVVVTSNSFYRPEDSQLSLGVRASPEPAADTFSTSATITSHDDTAGDTIASDPLDDSFTIKKTPPSKKKSKKKKGKKDDEPTEGASQPLASAQEKLQPSDDAVPAAEPALETNPESEQAAPPPPPPQDKLTTHAKLYSLSAKYGIAELQALSLSKFHDQAQSGWDADDFVHAAGRVYASPLLGDESHREMRGAVTGLVFGHRELLDKSEMRDILRGELGLDLIMRFRAEGVW